MFKTYTHGSTRFGQTARALLFAFFTLVGFANSALATDCNTISITPGQGSITIGNLNAPVVMIQVYNSAWAQVYSCSGNCTTPTAVVNNLPAGQYYVKVDYLTAAWQGVCFKDGYFTVTGGGGGNPCSMTATIGTKTCNDNGTPNDPTDDTFTFQLTATGTNTSSGWHGMIGPNMAPASGSYNQLTVLGPYPITNAQFDIWIMDNVDPNCQFDITITPPAPCSGGGGGTPNCNNVGITGGSGNISITGLIAPIIMVQVFNGSWVQVFSQTYTNSPGTVNVPSLPAGTYFVKVNFLNAAWTSVCAKEIYTTVTNGGNPCSITTTITNKVCNNNGTANNPNDDTYSFTLTVTGTNTSGQWQGGYSNAYLGTFQFGPTAYGTPINLGPFPAANFTPGNVFPPIVLPNGVDIDINVADVQTASCSKSTTVTSTGGCSNGGGGIDCSNISITATQGNINITGLTAPIVMVQAFDGNWAPVFNQTYTTAPGSVTIPNLATGSYFVKVSFLTATWVAICNKEAFVNVPPGNSVLTMNCIADFSVTAAPGANSAIVTYNTPTATTTCAGGAVTITRTSGPASGSSFPVGTTQVCYKATDNCGNVKTCCFNITVTASQSNLTMNCIADFSVTAAPGANSAIVTYNTPTATTTCAGGAVNITRTSGPASGSSFPVGTTQVCYKATDNCGNVKTCCFNITVTATQSNLTLNCIADFSVTAAPGANSAIVTYNTPTATTTCAGGAVTITRTSGPASGSSFPVGTTQVCYKATDNCGNVKTCCFSVTVNAVSNCTTPPTIKNCPSNITIVATAGAACAAVSWTPPFIRSIDDDDFDNDGQHNDSDNDDDNDGSSDSNDDDDDNDGSSDSNDDDDDNDGLNDHNDNDDDDFDNDGKENDCDNDDDNDGKEDDDDSDDDNDGTSDNNDDDDDNDGCKDKDDDDDDDDDFDNDGQDNDNDNDDDNDGQSDSNDNDDDNDGKSDSNDDDDDNDGVKDDKDNNDKKRDKDFDNDGQDNDWDNDDDNDGISDSNDNDDDNDGISDSNDDDDDNDGCHDDNENDDDDFDNDGINNDCDDDDDNDGKDDDDDSDDDNDGNMDGNDDDDDNDGCKDKDDDDDDDDDFDNDGQDNDWDNDDDNDGQNDSNDNDDDNDGKADSNDDDDDNDGCNDDDDDDDMNDDDDFDNDGKSNDDDDDDDNDGNNDHNDNDDDNDGNNDDNDDDDDNDGHNDDDDNSGNSCQCEPTSLTSTHNPGFCFPLGTTTVTYTATNAGGLTSVCVFTVTVNAGANFPDPNLCYKIVNKASGKVLDADGNPWLTQYSIDHTSSQRWKFEAATGGYFFVKSQSTSLTNKVIDIQNGSTSDGAYAVLATKTGADREKYKLQDAGNGYYYIVAKHSGKALKLENSPGSNGTKIIQQPISNSNEHQKWQVVAINCNSGLAILPSADLTFNAHKNGSTVELNWISNTGDLNDYFIVEHGTDGINWTPIGKVDGKGAANDRLYFSEKHNTPAKGDNYYRLVQIFRDGNSTISNVEIINMPTSKAFGLFPNPATGEVYVDLSEFEGQAVTLRLIGQMGNVVSTIEIAKATATAQLIDLKGFDNGIFQVEMVSNGVRRVAKLVVTKLD